MTLTEAKSLAEKLISEHVPTWKFDFNNRISAFGLCHAGKRKIFLSKHYVESGFPEKYIRNTILHEIAHALDYEMNGKMDHGPSWKEICIQIGCVPDRVYTAKECHKNPELPQLRSAKQAKYELYNTDTGEVYQKLIRKPNQNRIQNVHRMWINGKKSLTYGKLAYRKVSS